ncbi:MAG: O-antigen ligase family protein [Patescibacteria group bacterium]
MSVLSWGFFVALSVSAIFIALGVPLGPLLAVAVLFAFIFAFRYTYLSFYLALFFTPFLGFLVSIPTGELAFGKRAFGGSIDISVAEAILLIVLAVWAIKILLLWVKRHDINWRPKLPLVGSYAFLFAAHLLSAFSPLEPDPILTTKFALRPVLFCYLAYVALPVNLLRSRRRFLVALYTVVSVGTIAALNGAASLFFVGPESQFLRRAHPLPIFGIPALGDNHNLLAELLAATVFVTLALAYLEKKPHIKRLLFGSAALQLMIGLLTFSRTVWIVFLLQAAALAFIEYRQTVKKHLSTILAIILLCIPLVGIMLKIGTSNVAESSNSTRFALIEIAWEVFKTSPLIGSGAGTFVDRVGSAQVFRLEYGEPLDSHGVIQKLAAETGIVGVVAFIFVIISFGRLMTRSIRRLSDGPERNALLYLTVGAAGSVFYQFFNTNYWTAKIWLPVGLAVAATFVLLQKEEKDQNIFS